QLRQRQQLWRYVDRRPVTTARARIQEVVATATGVGRAHDGTVHRHARNADEPIDGARVDAQFGRDAVPVEVLHAAAAICITSAREIDRIERVFALARPEGFRLLVLAADVEVEALAFEIAVAPSRVDMIFIA